MSAIDAMGPGTPTPIAFSPRARGEGLPLQYQARGGQVAADVARGEAGTNMNAQFQLRPPIHPPGTAGIGEKGSFVDQKV